MAEYNGAAGGAFGRRRGRACHALVR